MCLVVFAWQSHPRYRLILAANRDEFHARPTQEAHWWPDNNSVLAGRDLQAGGTWLGLSRDGRFAAVTNYRERQQRHKSPRSRGDLVVGFLEDRRAPLDYSRQLDSDQFAGFSLLSADSASLASVSNRGEDARQLQPGVYGLSNAALDTPWHKLLRAKAALQSLLDSDEVNRTALMRLLRDTTPAPTDEVRSDDLPFALARTLTAPFIVSPDYGTRCSSVLLMDHDGQVEFSERSFASSGEQTGNRSFRYTASAKD